MRGALAPALVGFAAGALLALALSRAVASMLYELRPAHAPAYAGAFAAVAAVALVAAWIPARRAARLEPAAVLAAD
jgi:putative ABC transport system permease protein